MKICVYCASSPKVDAVYFDATARLGKSLVQHGVHVVYGGGGFGLMGKLADTILAEGGTITGVIPKFMHEVEWTHPGITDVIFTETMHQRKARFLEGIDGIIALAGGTGTLEELLEAITLKRLGLFTKPIAILNTAHFYDPLKKMFQKCADEKFIQHKHLEMWTFVDEPEAVIPTIKNTPEWHKNAIEFALVQ
ncbi:MAG: TIGR00730 family Rossman fold protein [Thermoguttaceae bacterium]